MFAHSKLAEPGASCLWNFYQYMVEYSAGIANLSKPHFQSIFYMVMSCLIAIDRLFSYFRTMPLRDKWALHCELLPDSSPRDGAANTVPLKPRLASPIHLGRIYIISLTSISQLDQILSQIQLGSYCLVKRCGGNLIYHGSPGKKSAGVGKGTKAKSCALVRRV